MPLVALGVPTTLKKSTKSFCLLFSKKRKSFVSFFKRVLKVLL
jgi:hypothetical protein